VTPENLPEVVDDAYFAAPATPPGTNTVGSFARKATRNHVEQTLHRIERFRDDVTWKIFPAPPGPEDLATVDVWVDPAVDEHDFDGFVAEALVVGLPVVAARTRVNSLRLEKGRTGLLVPPRDPNEMTHAILSALFKPEVAQARIGAAKQTLAKFRMRQRLRVLTQLYETLIA
jgi:glycosyltransferase involved in cell wall biosynthesis